MGSILVVREFDNFSRILAENGFSLINCPTIQAVALEDLSDFEAKLGRLDNYDGIFLTSAPAALIFRQKLNEQKVGFKGKVYVLGSRSFEILRTETLDLVFFDLANTAAEMLKMISLEDLSNKQFLFIGGDRSLRIVPDYLTDLSGVDECIVYQTRKIAVEIDKIKEIREQLEKRKIITACFFSPSGAESFIES